MSLAILLPQHHQIDAGPLQLAGIRCSPWMITRSLMPELLTRRNGSRRWPEIDRNPGRLQIGMVAGFKSERWPASPRNTRPASIGIRNKMVDGLNDAWTSIGE